MTFFLFDYSNGIILILICCAVIIWFFAFVHLDMQSNIKVQTVSLKSVTYRNRCLEFDQELLNKKRHEWRQKMRRVTDVKRSDLLMRDLAFYNPNAPSLDFEDDETVTWFVIISVDEESPSGNQVDNGVQSHVTTAPRIKIDEHGNTVIDEASLVVKLPPIQADAKNFFCRDDRPLNSRSFSTKSFSNVWKEYETENFYYALSIVGTDFALMQEFFSNRSRNDLKRKFLLEQRKNPSRIEKTLSLPQFRFANVSDKPSSSKAEVKNENRKRKPKIVKVKIEEELEPIKVQDTFIKKLLVIVCTKRAACGKCIYAQ
ncbi:Transcription factor TFIIIB component B'' -like protein, partial [Trichinella nelsoni]